MKYSHHQTKYVGKLVELKTYQQKVLVSSDLYIVKKIQTKYSKEAWVNRREGL